jgi:hypothetical protein
MPYGNILNSNSMTSEMGLAMTNVGVNHNMAVQNGSGG